MADQLDIELRSIGIGDAIVVTFTPAEKLRKVWFDVSVRLPLIKRRGLELPLAKLAKLGIGEDGMLRAPRAAPEHPPDGKWVLVVPVLMGIVDAYGRFEIEVYAYGRPGFWGKGKQLAAAAVTRQQPRPQRTGSTGCTTMGPPTGGPPMGSTPDQPPDREEMLKYAREQLGDEAVDEFLESRDMKKALRQKLVTEPPGRVVVWTLLHGVLTHRSRARKRRAREVARIIGWLLAGASSLLCAYLVLQLRTHFNQDVVALVAVALVVFNPAFRHRGRRKKRQRLPLQRALWITAGYLVLSAIIWFFGPSGADESAPAQTEPAVVEVESPPPPPEPDPVAPIEPVPAPEPPAEPKPGIEIIRLDQQQPSDGSIIIPKPEPSTK